jgi:serine/threonine-protein kinase
VWSCSTCGGTHQDEIEDCPSRPQPSPSTIGIHTPTPRRDPDDDAAAHDDLIGQAIGGYQITRRIGAGGMGAVYLGVHAALGKRVAVKVMLAAARGDALRRFFDEARAAAALDSPRIVEVIDLASLPDGRTYMMMEYLAGESLLQHARRRGKIPAAEVVAIAAQALDGLALAHAHGIVHRDIKPPNLFLERGPPPGVKLLDFGVAKLLGGGDRGSTRSGVVIGTPEYMSPEQTAAGTKAIDARADLYSLGVVAYELLAGRLPFEAESWLDIMVMHQKAPPPPLEGVRPEIAAVVLRALAKAPEDRFADAATMRAALIAAIGGEEKLAAIPAPLVVEEDPPKPITPRRDAVTKPERRPRRSVVPILVAAVAGALIVKLVSGGHAPQGSSAQQATILVTAAVDAGRVAPAIDAAAAAPSPPDAAPIVVVRHVTKKPVVVATPAPTPTIITTSTTTTGGWADVNYDNGAVTRHLDHCQYCSSRYLAQGETAEVAFQQDGGQWTVYFKKNAQGGWDTDIGVGAYDDALPARLHGSFWKKRGTIKLTKVDIRNGGSVDGTFDVYLEGGMDKTPIPCTMRGAFHGEFPP